VCGKGLERGCGYAKSGSEPTSISGIEGGGKNYRGRFVAIAQGRIVAAGLSFEETIKKADEAAPEASQRIVLKVGEEYPQTITVGASSVQ